MTEEQRTAFIKDKLAPLFDGMNAGDAWEIIFNTLSVYRNVMSRFTLSQCQEKD